MPDVASRWSNLQNYSIGIFSVISVSTDHWQDPKGLEKYTTHTLFEIQNFYYLFEESLDLYVSFEFTKKQTIFREKEICRWQ